MLQPNDAAQAAIQTLNSNQVEEISLDRMRWANRRRMAWVFTYAAIIMGYLVFTCIILGNKEIADRISQNTDLLVWVFMGYLSIPSLYFGGTVIEKFNITSTKKPQ